MPNISAYVDELVIQIKSLQGGRETYIEGQPGTGRRPGMTKKGLRQILSEIRDDQVETLRRRTPASGAAGGWAGQIRHAGGTIETRYMKSADKGHRIYAALLMGARTTPWIIRPKNGKALAFRARYKKLTGNNPKHSDRLKKSRVVVTGKVTRRYAHRVNQGWTHPNFYGIDRVLQRQAQLVLAKYGLSGVTVQTKLIR